MAAIETKAKLADPDRAYRLLIEAHRGRTEAESAALNACLVLVLANEIGDLEKLRGAIALACEAVARRAATAGRSGRA
jgi:anthranilate phosphoribosyltransferase